MTAYQPYPHDPPQAIEIPLTTTTLNTGDNNRKEIPVDLSGLASPVSVSVPVFVSVRVRVDTTVPPGLYDDFVVTRLLNKSANFTFVATFGFSN